MRLAGHHELIQLRRRHGAAGQHGVHLAAVVRLVVEQMRQHVASTVALHVVCARQVDPGVDGSAVEAGAPGHQALVAGMLAPHPFGGLGTGLEGGVVLAQPRLVMQRADVVVVHRQDMVQRAGQAGEETAARRQPGRGIELKQRTAEPMIGQGVGVRLDAQVSGQLHRQPLTALSATGAPAAFQAL